MASLIWHENTCIAWILLFRWQKLIAGGGKEAARNYGAVVLCGREKENEKAMVRELEQGWARKPWRMRLYISGETCP